jgi:pilus assembly protein TadC
MSELAQESRCAAENAAAASAERAGVLISGPLGLCFLPAFICLGIVPVVVGLASKVIGGGLL